MGSQLFRQAVIDQHVNRLHGDVLLLPRFSHTLLITLLLLWLLAMVIWLLISSYARKETVVGWLEPASGIIRVYAEDTGIVKKMLVSEGDAVIEGQPLMIVNGDRVLADGDLLEHRLLNEYESQRRLLDEQLTRTTNIYQRRQKDIHQRITANQDDLVLLDEQLATLDQRYQLVQAQVERYRALRRNGHVSSLDMDNALSQKLALHSERQALLREQVNRRNLIQQLETEQALLPEEHANSIDQLRTRLSDLAQRIAQMHGQRAHIVRASRDGIVNNLQVREGQQVSTGNPVPLLTLMPVDSPLDVQLLIPVRAAGFVTPGQSLDIRYDAFPYQKFGVYQGEVTQVSETILLPGELLNAAVAVQEPVYRVIAQLGQPHVQAYGQNLSLKPGMTLSADVRLQERSLLKWLMEPIYSLKGRL